MIRRNSGADSIVWIEEGKRTIPYGICVDSRPENVRCFRDFYLTTSHASYLDLCLFPRPGVFTYSEAFSFKT
jgi:hypothetical protein